MIRFILLFCLLLVSLSQCVFAFKLTTTYETADYWDRTHRRVFRLNGYDYVFYLNNNSELVYRYSKEGGNFSGEMYVASEVWGYSDFGLHIKENEVHLIYSYAVPISSYRVTYRRGSIQETGRILWSEARAVDEGDYPFITITDDDRPAVVYRNRDDRAFYWRISQNKEGSIWGNRSTLLKWESNDKDFFPAVYGLEDGLMFIYWHGGTDRIYAKHWNTSLSEPVMLYNCFDYSMSMEYFYYCWSAVVDKESNLYFANPIGRIGLWNNTSKSWEGKIGKAPKRGITEILSAGLSYDSYYDEVYITKINRTSREATITPLTENDENGTFLFTFGNDAVLSSFISFEHIAGGYIGNSWFEGDANNQFDVCFSLSSNGREYGLQEPKISDPLPTEEKHTQLQETNLPIKLLLSIAVLFLLFLIGYIKQKFYS